MNSDRGKRPVLIGNVSGSTGDRLDGTVLRHYLFATFLKVNIGLKQMLSGDTKVDAITGDWLSEVGSVFGPFLVIYTEFKI